MPNPPPNHDDERSPARRRPNATPEQLAARRQLADARSKSIELKKRTRQLIQVGGVMAAFGVDTPEQAQRLMEALVSPSRPGSRRFLLDELGARKTDRWRAQQADP